MNTWGDGRGSELGWSRLGGEGRFGAKKKKSRTSFEDLGHVNCEMPVMSQSPKVSLHRGLRVDLYHHPPALPCFRKGWHGIALLKSMFPVELFVF